MSTLATAAIRDRIRGCLFGTSINKLMQSDHTVERRKATRTASDVKLTNKCSINAAEHIIGNAIGDAYGLATEFMTTRMAERLYGNGPIVFGTDPG